ncbi:MAG TPA: PEP-CTERM sorting domain-containing protein [Planctomycetes bacterium]|nr:PEP-CTERM sorting domain-containing protein [Planctomycetota bacterium]
MKRLIPCLLLLPVFVTISFGEIVFDYTISDTYEGSVMLNSESLLVTGAGALQIDAKGESYIEVQGTDPLQQFVGGIYTLDLDDFSILNYYDGETSLFTIYDDATATFSGGSINYISSFQDSDLIQHITFIADVDSIDLTGNLLTGDWLNDGGSFSITLLDQTGYDSVYSNINFVPEPATIALFGLGYLLLRKRT